MQDLVTKKESLLLKKYTPFGANIILHIQKKDFVKNMNLLFLDINTSFSPKSRTKYILKLYNYLYQTRDIWATYGEFFNAIKNKLFEFAELEQNFKEYLYLFEFICSYPDNEGNKCGTKIDHGLCEKHTKAKKILKTNIDNGIMYLPSNLCSIIFDYTTPC